MRFVTESLVPELGGLAANLDDALSRIDYEMAMLSATNAELARVVKGTVDGLHDAVEGQLPSETARAQLRLFGFLNAIVLLRTLDMSWRQSQPS
jgi:hypothetical protein